MPEDAVSVEEQWYHFKSKCSVLLMLYFDWAIMCVCMYVCMYKTRKNKMVYTHNFILKPKRETTWNTRHRWENYTKLIKEIDFEEADSSASVYCLM
jgi:hypothetical protein